MGNGNRAQQKRERKNKDAPKEAKSQLKSNAAATDHKCKKCFVDFFKTARRPEIMRHMEAKHPGMAVEDCITNHENIRD
ncbi:At2g23090 like protein [Xylariaceae sp. FL1272]|nr:At2g23090 like protein [Xylariaceae sp. FL1272]